MDSESQNSIKLDRILEVVQQDDQSSWGNLLSTVLLSLATVISAWCVYQSSQWGGEQYFRIEDQNIADRDRLKYELTVIQRKAIDLSYFLEFVSAITADDQKLSDFLMEKCPPHLKRALLAWHETGPLLNPLAPESPFVMKEYVIPEEALVAQSVIKANALRKSANTADKHSDNYVFISLVLSTVLFFSGLCGLTESHIKQKILIGVASTIFAIAVFVLTRMPVMF